MLEAFRAVRSVFALTLFLLFTGTLAHGQSNALPTVASGKCSAKSGVTVGDGEISHFDCDVVVIAHTTRGVLIQFADKTGDDGRLLGFAGTIEGKQGFGAEKLQAVEVERLYLIGGGDAVPVEVGTCFMNWTGLQRTGGKLTSVTCGARGSAEGTEIKAIVQLEVTR